MSNTKKGLVLGGGGSKGSYEAGVCEALNDLGFSFDVVTGTSIGGLTGALYTAGNMSGLKAWVSSFQQNQVATNLFIFPNQYQMVPAIGKSINVFLDSFTQNGPSTAPLVQRYQEVFSFEQFMKSPVDFSCVAWNVTGSKPAVFYKKDMTKEDYISKLIASTAYFPAFNLEKIGGDYYIDGGYWQTVPISVCKEMGADEIIAVSLEDPGQPSKAQIEPGDQVTLIRPILKLIYLLDFSGPQLAKQMEQGYLETLKYLNKAPGYLYTFYPDDWTHMMLLEKAGLDYVVGIGKISLLEQMQPVMDEIYSFLLGYIPQPLKNDYSESYVFGRLLEVMGVIAGVDMYQQIHFRDFIKEMLQKFKNFTSDPNFVPAPAMYNAMEMKGLKDYIVFFHTALESYGNSLPESFDVFKQGEYLLPFYMAFGWHLIEKFQLAFIL